ncbi:MAG: histidine--tRNA ligase [Clostridiales bacterium]|nr:histidine--tRNA ligase [Clostridiales bacterium]
MLTRAPRGTKDILPEESFKWHYIEENIRKVTKLFGYEEIRTPVFEHTELFQRGVGDTTDIVQKEMYTFLDKGNRSITLKPEGTAGVARAYIENSLYAQAQPIKTYYITPVFRYEAPQSGRLRQHHQFGIEVFGAKEPSIDAEIIGLAMHLLNKLEVGHIHINISSIGCPRCRPDYQSALKDFLQDRYDGLCTSCQDRYYKNPLRILDCKEDTCQDLLKDVPVILDYLCKECSDHFELLKEYLTAMGLQFQVNPMIVRGLDYYTKTVFELIASEGKFKGTVCGGGRYDGLVEEFGGPSTSGIGFGMGIDRLLMVMEGQKTYIPDTRGLDVSFVTIGDKAKTEAIKLVTDLRDADISSDIDHVGRSIRAQFKYNDRIEVPWVCILGDDELDKGIIKLRNMKTGEEEDIALEKLTEVLKDRIN